MLGRCRARRDTRIGRGASGTVGYVSQGGRARARAGPKAKPAIPPHQHVAASKGERRHEPDVAATHVGERDRPAPMERTHRSTYEYVCQASEEARNRQNRAQNYM